MRRFGEYDLGRRIGQGGMGVVHEAFHRTSGERVAVKLLSGLAADNARAQRRFLREARLAGQVSHPNVVRVLQADVDHGRPFIVMPYLAGGTLAAHLQQRGRLPLEQVVSLFLPICSAVSAIHRASIVHRDLKASNVILRPTPSGELDPIVLDFGISRVDEGWGIAGELSDTTEETTLTRSHALLGTPGYLSPEQALNAKAASPLSDQYSLGVMLFEAATGARPFVGRSTYELLHAIVSGELSAPSALCRELPANFDAIVLQAMSRDVNARFADVDALARALRCLPVRSKTDACTGVVEVQHCAQPDDITQLDSRDQSTAARLPSVARAPLLDRPVVRATLALAVALSGVALASLLQEPEAKLLEARRSRQPASVLPSASHAAQPLRPSAEPPMPTSSAPIAASVAERPALTPPAGVVTAWPRARRPTAGSSALPMREPAPARPHRDVAIDPFAPEAE